MFEDIKQYFLENVLAEYNGYLRQRKNNKSGFSEDVKCGLRSASALFHFREHLPKELKMTRAQVVNICANYSLLGDVVNVSKHGIIDRNNPQISNSKNIYEEIFVTTYMDKKGEYQHIQKEVVIELDSGEYIILFEILTEIMNMWINQLNGKGLFNELSFFTTTTKRLPRRNKNSGRLDFLTTNHFYGRRFRAQKYNYDLKKIEPMNLSDVGISFNVYKNTYPVSIEIIPKQNGEPILLEMELNEKQMNLINSIQENEKRAFELLKIAESKNLIKLSNET
ncbi:MAG: hypothetical protein JXR53_10815 [Bacteroidales bacterium]|nr:hypothetical protein [Bacteroidales bacterium]